MAPKPRTETGKLINRMPMAIVEPVFWQAKERRGFRRFRFRGIRNVGVGWKLICLTGDLLKQFRSGWLLQTAQTGGCEDRFGSVRR